MATHCDVLIIGAGISGLCAARKLVEAGDSAILLERNPTVGGRITTQSLHDEEGLVRGRWDTGAQFATWSSNAVSRQLTYWDALHLMKPWHTGPGGLIRTRPLNGMGEFPKTISRGLDVRTEHNVESVTYSSRSVSATTASGETFHASKLLVTLPVPQAMRLFTHSNVFFSSDIEERLASVRYDRCFSLLAELEGPSGTDFLGFVDLEGEGSILRRIIDNQFKHINEMGHTITAHSTAAYAEANWKRNPMDLQSELCAELQRHISSQITDATLLPWEYANASRRIQADCLEASAERIWLAGDSFAASDRDASTSRPCRIEAAILSGLAAAEQLMAN